MVIFGLILDQPAFQHENFSRHLDYFEADFWAKTILLNYCIELPPCCPCTFIISLSFIPSGCDHHWAPSPECRLCTLVGLWVGSKSPLVKATFWHELEEGEIMFGACRSRIQNIFMHLAKSLGLLYNYNKLIFKKSVLTSMKVQIQFFSGYFSVPGCPSCLAAENGTVRSLMALFGD